MEPHPAKRVGDLLNSEREHDLLQFFRRLRNPDKQFPVMAGISHASFQQNNYPGVDHILHAFFSLPEPVCRS